MVGGQGSRRHAAKGHPLNPEATQHVCVCMCVFAANTHTQHTRAHLQMICCTKVPPMMGLKAGCWLLLMRCWSIRSCEQGAAVSGAAAIEGEEGTIQRPSPLPARAALDSTNQARAQTPAGA